MARLDHGCVHAVAGGLQLPAVAFEHQVNSIRGADGTDVLVLSMLVDGTPWYVLREIYNTFLAEHKWAYSSLIAMAEQLPSHTKVSKDSWPAMLAALKEFDMLKPQAPSAILVDHADLVNLLSTRASQLHHRWWSTFNSYITQLNASLPAAITPAAPVPGPPSAALPPPPSAAAALPPTQLPAHGVHYSKLRSQYSMLSTQKSILGNPTHPYMLQLQRFRSFYAAPLQLNRKRARQSTATLQNDIENIHRLCGFAVNYEGCQPSLHSYTNITTFLKFVAFNKAKGNQCSSIVSQCSTAKKVLEWMMPELQGPPLQQLQAVEAQLASIVRDLPNILQTRPREVSAPVVCL
jgi:hypothetical protein